MTTITQLFSQHCACCRQPGPLLCRSCRFSLASSSAVVGDGNIEAAMPFDGAGRSAIVSLKYRNRRPVAQQLAVMMVRRLRLAGVHEHRYDLVTWAPTSTARLRERGFDQAELIAREVAKLLGVPCRRLLYRSHGAPQTGQGRAARLGEGRPTFRSRTLRSGVRVLVIDDVVTTGATLHAAREALAAAGIDHVRLVAAAATPRRPIPLHRARPAALALAQAS